MARPVIPRPPVDPREPKDPAARLARDRLEEYFADPTRAPFDEDRHSPPALRLRPVVYERLFGRRFNFGAQINLAGLIVQAYALDRLQRHSYDTVLAYVNNEHLVVIVAPADFSAEEAETYQALRQGPDALPLKKAVVAARASHLGLEDLGKA